jgi:hypothetical protein
MPAISGCRSPSNSSGSLHERVTKTYHSLVPTPDLRRNLIKHSSKFDDTPGHYKAYTEDGMILFRIVRADGERSYTVMTATAGEDDGTLSPYPDKERLMAAAMEAFANQCASPRGKFDRNGIPYVQFYDLNDPSEIQSSIETTATALGLSAAKIEWIDVAAQNEAKDLWREFSVGDEFSDEPAYLSDGLWVNSDGSFSTR